MLTFILVALLSEEDEETQRGIIVGSRARGRTRNRAASGVADWPLILVRVLDVRSHDPRGNPYWIPKHVHANLQLNKFGTFYEVKLTIILAYGLT